METTLINDLLDVSAAARGKLDLDLDLVDLEEVVRQSLPLFQNDIREKNITLNFQVRTHATLVIGAAIRLHQIVNNLLSNALKSTPEGGRIRVQLDGDTQLLRLSVEDNGRGIDPASLERIFQPFEQGDRDSARLRAGLGLGLTIARTIAESHHGRLTAHSAGVGQGAIFVLELPLAAQQRRSRMSTKPLSKSDLVDVPKPKLLLVEDHADTLHTLALLLRKSGYEVETATTFREAEPLLLRADVLVSDIGLPDGNGCDLMRRFKECGGLAGIAITGFGQEEDIQRSRHAGFSKHLTKPVDIEVLKTALHELHPSALSTA